MNSSTPDPLRGHDPADLLAAAMPTEDGADTPPLDRADLPSLEEIAAAFPELEILGLIGRPPSDPAPRAARELSG